MVPENTEALRFIHTEVLASDPLVPELRKQYRQVLASSGTTQRQTPDLGNGPGLSKNTDVLSLALLLATGTTSATLSPLSQSAFWTQRSRLPNNSAAETTQRPFPKLTWALRRTSLHSSRFQAWTPARLSYEFRRPAVHSDTQELSVLDFSVRDCVLRSTTSIETSKLV